ncbi:hypothetical protein BaRGS_00013094 [Batillaria attramentaria]|uniref:Uncharacterized protein n=1 Tax=Batillaria attramentaria TaxID=370345 RepID=A0ABD0L860_9CAEN
MATGESKPQEGKYLDANIGLALGSPGSSTARRTTVFCRQGHLLLSCHRRGERWQTLCMICHASRAEGGSFTINASFKWNSIAANYLLHNSAVTRAGFT